MLLTKKKKSAPSVRFTLLCMVIELWEDSKMLTGITHRCSTLHDYFQATPSGSNGFACMQRKVEIQILAFTRCSETACADPSCFPSFQVILHPHPIYLDSSLLMHLVFKYLCPCISSCISPWKTNPGLNETLPVNQYFKPIRQPGGIVKVKAMTFWWQP